MFFFLKRSKIVIDAFTYSPAALEYFPIDHANNFVPEWFKRVPKDIDGVELKEGCPKTKGNTIRRCVGFLDYYSKNSFIMPLWTDIKFESGADGYRYICADRKSEIQYHPQAMRGNEYLANYEHFKLLSVWRVTEKSGVKMHFGQSFYNFDDPRRVIIPPAIVNFKYQHATELQFFVERTAKTQTLEFKAGQPLVHFTPLSDKEIEIRTHLQSYDEWMQSRQWIFAFNGNYLKAKKIKDQKEKKCPFGFGK